MGRREEKAETNYRIKANLKTSHELLLLNIGSTFQEFNSCKESLSPSPIFYSGLL